MIGSFLILPTSRNFSLSSTWFFFGETHLVCYSTNQLCVSALSMNTPNVRVDPWLPKFFLENWWLECWSTFKAGELALTLGRLGEGPKQTLRIDIENWQLVAKTCYMLFLRLVAYLKLGFENQIIAFGCPNMNAHVESFFRISESGICRFAILGFPIHW